MNIFEKYKNNLESAQILYDERKSSSCVHCYYYGCFQLSKYILNSACSINYEMQEKEKGKGSHNFIIDSLATDIANKTNNNKLRVEFYQSFHSLKNRREKADYSNIKIGEKFAKKAELDSSKIIDILKQTYSIEI